MNAFNLIKTQNIESIKLGLEVIKTLNKEKDFKKHFKTSFQAYFDIFNEFVLQYTENKPFEYKMVVKSLLANHMQIKNIDNISFIIGTNPILIEYFDLTKLEGQHILYLLLLHPHLVNRLQVHRLIPNEINFLTKRHPELKEYFNNK